MTQHRKVKELKTIAKRVARSLRIEHHKALDLVAREIGFSHWYAVSVARRRGWLPGTEHVAKATSFLELINPASAPIANEPENHLEMFGDPGGRSAGQIGSHTYTIEVLLDDVYMSGRGWSIQVPEAPSCEPIIEVTDRQYKDNPIHDPIFIAQALEIANAKAEQVRARIATEWTRNSTKPNAQGRAVHPLHGSSSDKWYCLHCDVVSTARAVASNMWHCPSCSASPIDIFNSPWWLEDSSDYSIRFG